MDRVAEHPARQERVAVRAKDLATGKWPSILSMMGVDSDILDGRHHPCPKGEGVDRFRFADRNGSGNYFCSCSDGEKGGMALLMCCKGYSYAEAAKEVEKLVHDAKPTSIRPSKDPAVALNAVRKGLKPAGDAVRLYLENRKLETQWPIRQGRLTYWNMGQKTGEYDAMVCPISDVTGKALTYHVTYLENGRKAGIDPARKIMTPVKPISGGAIRLCEPAEEMGVAEGVETALSIPKLFQVPTWSCISDGMLAAFDPPSIVKKLWIFGDHDRNFAGQAAAYQLAKRMAARGIECFVTLPREPGDWNDVLMTMP